jgi:uncharacterized membrane protein
LVLTSTDAINQTSQRIFQQVVATRAMPLANSTQMTDLKRAMIAQWVADGARPQ